MKLSEDETLSKQTGPSGEVMDTSGVVEEEFANYSSGCTGYCVPLYIYAALAVLSIGWHVVRKGLNNMQRLTTVLCQVLVSVAIGYVIYLLCKQCNTTIAWVILLIPVLVVSGLAATLVTVASNLLKGVSKTVVGTVMPKSSKKSKRRKRRKSKK